MFSVTDFMIINNCCLLHSKLYAVLQLSRLHYSVLWKYVDRRLLSTNLRSRKHTDLNCLRNIILELTVYASLFYRLIIIHLRYWNVVWSALAPSSPTPRPQLFYENISLWETRTSSGGSAIFVALENFYFLNNIQIHACLNHDYIWLKVVRNLS